MAAMLKLVHGSKPQARRECLIVGKITRKQLKAEDRSICLERKSVSHETAIPRLTQFMLQQGRVDDVCQVFHSVTGLEIGTIRMTATGRLVTDWIWDRKDG